MLKKSVLVVFFYLLFAVPFGAHALPEPMSPRRLVNDFAGVMTPQQQQALEQKLIDFDRETSTQVAVVTVDDLDGYAVADYAQRLYDKWGVGQSGKNNGILMLIKPKMPDSRGEAFISVGYGLEGAIPDITAGRIVEQEMLPAFRQNDYYTGIDRAADVVMQLTRGEFTADQYNGADPVGAEIIGVIVVVIFVILLSAMRRKGGGKNGGNSGGRGVWFPPVIMGGGRSGGFGGGSFGGFGGFGGGMSGGGGGGRSW